MNLMNQFYKITIAALLVCFCIHHRVAAQSETTPKLGLELLFPSQQDKSETINESLLTLDGTVQLNAIGAATWVIAASAEEGDVYIVSTTEIAFATQFTNAIGNATGDWTGRENYIAQKINGSWRFIQPAAGWVLRTSETISSSQTREWLFNGNVWYAIKQTAVSPGIGFHQFHNRVVLVDKRVSGDTELASINAINGYGWLELNDSSGDAVITLDAGNHLFKPPGVDTAIRDAITNATGSIIFNMDFGRLEYYSSDAAGWVTFATQ